MTKMLLQTKAIQKGLMVVVVSVITARVFTPAEGRVAAGAAAVALPRDQGSMTTTSKRQLLQAYSGDLTWYDDVGFTSCGVSVPGDGDYAAISWPLSGALDPSCSTNPNKCSWCGRVAAVSGPLGCATVRVIDKCSACKYGDIDVTKTTFQKIAGSLDLGRVKTTWQWGTTCGGSTGVSPAVPVVPSPSPSVGTPPTNTGSCVDLSLACPTWGPSACIFSGVPAQCPKMCNKCTSTGGTTGGTTTGGTCVDLSPAECSAWGAASCIYPGVPEKCPKMCRKC